MAPFPSWGRGQKTINIDEHENTLFVKTDFIVKEMGELPFGFPSTAIHVVCDTANFSEAPAPPPPLLTMLNRGLLKNGTPQLS